MYLKWENNHRYIFKERFFQKKHLQYKIQQLIYAGVQGCGQKEGKYVNYCIPLTEESR